MTGYCNAQFSVSPKWQWARLGDHVFKVGSGVTPTGGQSVYRTSGIPLIRSQNVLMNRFERQGLAYISEDQDAEMSGSRVQPGDVLLNITGASIGRVCVAPAEICPANVNQHVCIIRPNGNIIPEFLALYLATPQFQQFIADCHTGATRQALTKVMVENFRVPFPPLEEQRRISGQLREELVELDKARAAVKFQLERVQALPPTFLRAFFENEEGGVWPKRHLGELLRLRKDVVHPRDKPRGKTKFVGLEHIESHTGRRLGTVEVEMEALTGRKPRFRTGDIVYGYLRPYLNKVWLAEFDGLCSVDQYVYKVREEVADPEFLGWFMRSPTYLSRAPIDTTPGQLPRIRTDEVAGVPINLPALDAQRAIARRIQRVIHEQLHLRAAIAQKLAALDHLPASLLSQAFPTENCKPSNE